MLITFTLGSFAAAGIAYELCDEDDEIALEQVKETAAAPAPTDTRPDA